MLVQLGFMRHYDPAYLQLREAVLGGSIGQVKAAHCVHRNPRAHPTHTDESVLFGSMIHEFDSVPWLLDDPLAAVTVFASRVPEGELKDLQVGVFETANGTVVTVEVFINASYGYDIHTEVTGTGGTVSLTPPYGVSVRRSISDTSGVDGRVVTKDGTERYLDAYRLEVGAWIHDIRAGGTHRALVLGRLPRQRRGLLGHRVAAPRWPRRAAAGAAAGALRPGLSRARRRSRECTGLCTGRASACAVPSWLVHTLCTDSAAGLGDSSDVLWLLGAPSYSHGVPRGTMSESRQFGRADTTQLEHT